MAPLYFDVWPIVLYLCVFLVACIGALLSHGAVRQFFGGVLLLCVVTPFLLFAIAAIEHAYQNHEADRQKTEREAAFERSKASGREALKRFCASNPDMPVCH